MKDDILEKILSDLLSTYLSYGDHIIEQMIKRPGFLVKERVGRIDNLELRVYPIDHEPPHFHVVCEKLDINARFKIADGEYMNGSIDSRNLKKVKAFFLSPKTQIVLEKARNTWNKRN